jgi:hypothetical protein
MNYLDKIGLRVDNIDVVPTLKGGLEMRYMFAISALAGALLLPQIASTVVLWQDDFEEYPEFMLLEDSPSWDKVDLVQEGDSFQVRVDDDKWIWYEAPFDQTSLYIANGGADNPDMKVSAHEVVVRGYTDWLWGYDIFGGIATRLSGQGNGYVALLEWERVSEYVIDKHIDIGALYYGYYHQFASHKLEGWSSYHKPEITIIASGQNPVHIQATFMVEDQYQELSYDDYTYCYDGGFGGIYVYFDYASYDGIVEMDDFTEEEFPANIQPTSLGSIKAIYK